MSDIGGNLPKLGRIYPQAGTWLFRSNGFCISGNVTWSYVDESSDVVLGDGFSCSFSERATFFDGRRAEFKIGDGNLTVYLPFVLTNIGQLKNPVRSLQEKE